MALAVFSIKMVPRSSAITNLTKRKKKETSSKQNLEMTHTHQQSQESSNQKEK